MLEIYIGLALFTTAFLIFALIAKPSEQKR
jgi:hypothetical protein